MLRHSHVVLSPGPGNPDVRTDFSVGREVLLAGSRPVLGVCLGLQGLVTAYGGTVARNPPAHGETALIDHDGQGVFRGVPPGFRAVRYHSLAAWTVPSCLRVTATCARRHRRATGSGGDGSPARDAAARGRAVPPRVDPVRARCPARGELPGALVTDPVAHFREIAAAHPRCFWLDGGGAREWSGRRSIIGWLEPSRRLAHLLRHHRPGVAPPGRHDGRGGRRHLLRPRPRARDRRGGRPVVRLLRVRLPPRPARDPGPRPARCGVDAGPPRPALRP